MLLEHFGIQSKTEVSYPRHVVLARGDDEIGIPLHPSAYDPAIREVFSPLVIIRIMERYHITREEFCVAYNQYLRAA